MSQVVVCALYKFVTLDNYQAIRQPLLEVMLAQQIRGTLLLAREDQWHGGGQSGGH